MDARKFLSRDVKLRHLRLLVAIDDVRQLSKVARLLHVTQPSVSKALAQIEASAGASLFERTPKGLLPTVLGAVIVRSARDVLAELERAGAEVERLSRGHANALSIGAMPSAALAILGPALALLRQRQPELALRVSEAPTDELLSRLVAGRLDVALGSRLRPALPDGVAAHALYEDPLVIVAGATHPAARRARMHWDELAAGLWILTPPPNPLRLGFERALRAHAMAVPRQVIDSSMMDLALRMVAAGDALTLTPRRQAFYLQGLGLWRIVAQEHAQALGLALSTTLFTPTGGVPAPGIGTLLACLEEVQAAGEAPVATPRR